LTRIAGKLWIKTRDFPAMERAGGMPDRSGGKIISKEKTGKYP
jgi:hypothetical protein